jgi:hypothetical protein
MRAFTLAFMVAAVATVAAAAEPPGEDPHAGLPPLTASLVSCAECHPKRAGVPLPAAPAYACAAACAKCHDRAESHHPVGKKLEAEAPVTVALGRRATVECFTCHALGQPRFDQRPRRSQSLFDRLFRKPDLRTYYLPVSNHDGGLCRVCH